MLTSFKICVDAVHVITGLYIVTECMCFLLAAVYYQLLLQ
jgi:hypothetical protein